MFAFMEAADESKRATAPVTLEEVIAANGGPISNQSNYAYPTSQGDRAARRGIGRRPLFWRQRDHRHSCRGNERQIQQTPHPSQSTPIH